MRREIRTLGNTWATYRIDAQGSPWLAANLHALWARAWWYQVTGNTPGWIHGEFAQGLFPDLPWFLYDLRPQGFMGRAFARRYADELGLGPDPGTWDAAGVLAALVLHGEDLPGDFVIGDIALERLQRASLGPPPAIALADRPTQYCLRLRAALAGDVVGSSAGGEQPKFAACVDDGGSYRHVLVKFSPPQDTALGGRWADLLVCEHLGAELLSEYGVTACKTVLLEAQGRSFLEVTRFDRNGAYGRHGFATLFALDSAHYGKLDNWGAASDRLQRDGWLTADDADSLRLVWWFGRLIGNTDMHFANVSFALDGTRPLRLAPAYDMLPMHYRPAATGEVLMTDLSLPLPTPQLLSIWRRAARLALVFWQRAQSDSRISDDFRTEAGRVHDALRSLAERFG